MRSLGPLLTVATIALLTVAAHAADQSVRLAVGQRTTVELQENPSTGYRWAIDTGASSNLAILRIADAGYTQGGGDKPLLGAPGIHRWTVEAVGDGSAEVNFVYRRPWEGQAIRTHRLSVTVTKR